MNTQPTATTRPAGALHRVRPWAVFCLLWAVAVAGWAQAAVLPAVVVWDFDNQSPGVAQPGAGTDYLRRALSENLTRALLQVDGLPVVERQRLRDLLAEQKLASAAPADEDSRLRLGKIVGAQRMVFGGYFVLGDEVQVHVRLVDTATSRVLFSDETTGPLPQVMARVAPLNERLARSLGSDSPGPGARPAGLATGPRQERTELWQAYDRALALADAGDFDAAVTALQALLAQGQGLHPGRAPAGGAAATHVTTVTLA